MFTAIGYGILIALALGFVGMLIYASEAALVVATAVAIYFACVYGYPWLAILAIIAALHINSHQNRF